ncbi:MAG: TolC family protein [Betaproteobacteria bacterium]|nr:MAG: TolC family protein [Betaproteobacteria bacterium]
MVYHRAARAAVKRTTALAPVVLILLFSSTPFAQPPLTLEEAQRRAVERSRGLAAQDFATTASREMAVAAGQLPDPIVTLGVNNLPIDTSDRFSLTRDFMTMRSVGVMQEFTRTEKREARAERFEREAEKSFAEKDVSLAAIQRGTALAWLDRYYAEAMQTVISEQSRQAQLEIEAAESAYRAGRGNLADILAARNALVLLDDRASEVGRKASAAKIALARWIGNDADAPLAGKPAIDAIRLDPSTLEADIAHHPEIAVLARKEDIAAADVRVAQTNKKADWSVALMYSQRGPAYSNMISVNVSVPLQWDQKNRQDRELAAKLAMLDQARAEREDMLRAHTAEVRAMIAEWENDRERSARYAREVLPLATERSQATLGAYRGAKASITDVLLARRSEIEVRMQALQLDMDTARLWAQLNFLFSADDASRAASTSTEHRR